MIDIYIFFIRVHHLKSTITTMPKASEISPMDSVRAKLAEIFTTADTDKSTPDGMLSPSEIATKLDLGKD